MIIGLTLVAMVLILVLMKLGEHGKTTRTISDSEEQETGCATLNSR